MAKYSHPWAMALAQAFKKWCAERNIDSNRTLAEWGIDSDARYEILTRKSLTSKMEAYGMIYIHTELPESDPRQRPFTQKAKPWSEDEWQMFKTAFAQKEAIVPMRSHHPVRHGTGDAARDTALQTLSKLSLQDILDLAQIQLANGDDLGAQMQKLLVALKTQGGSKEGRDRIANKYAGLIDALAGILDALTLQEDQRDQAFLLKGVVSDE